MGIGLIERYRERLALAPGTEAVSLGEGSTPLLHVPRLSARLGIELYVKWEGANPTGSFKDRGMCVAVSQALAEGADAVICASTGNTAASAAAYASRAGLRAIVLEPEGAVALGKLAQARAAGATVLAVRGSFDQALAAARELGTRGTHVLVNSVNPYRIEGQKTAAFEIAEELGRVPDVLALPYGGGGNTRAFFKGFSELGEVPRFLPCQSAERGTTLASAIRISEPAHAAEVAEAVAASDGTVLTVTDPQIIEAWHLLAHEEGIFCEPASAAGLAGLLTAGLPPGTQVVCVVTGHGLKDTEAVDRTAPEPATVDADPDAIAEAAR